MIRNQKMLDLSGYQMEEFKKFHDRKLFDSINHHHINGIHIIFFQNEKYTVNLLDTDG